jgi:hypothetical protein
VNPGLELYMKAFWDLCCDRYAEGHRIPWTAIQAWCEAHRIEYDEQEDVRVLVGKLDIAYLQWMQKKQKKPAKPEQAKEIRKK